MTWRNCMRKLWRGVPALLLLSWVVPARAYVVNPEMIDHLFQAAQYEKLAREQKSLAEQHEKMRKDYAERTQEEGGPSEAAERHAEHCAKIIADANRLQADYLEFAEWHRRRAAEIGQGKAGKPERRKP